MGWLRAILLFGILIAPSAGLSDDAVRSGATAYGLARRRAGHTAPHHPGRSARSVCDAINVECRAALSSTCLDFPKALAGFAVDLFADGLSAPRVIRVAPNGDIFVAESGAGRVRSFSRR